MHLTTHRVLFQIFLLVPLLTPAIADPIYDAGNKSQLFVDQFLVLDSENVAHTLHPARKHPNNPLVKADKPWEGWRLEIYGNVIYDEEEQLFKMWYLGEERDAFPDYALYYATSKDGVNWEKP
ncbi:MAG: hypothetical protein KC917_22795, partial [Candidatus Omnitrophica bacterium]|nr:hypothetical protein [Candidatus Omnitrophota bacterium]